MRERAVLFRILAPLAAWIGAGWITFAVGAELVWKELGHELTDKCRVEAVGYSAAVFCFALSVLLWQRSKRHNPL